MTTPTVTTVNPYPPFLDDGAVVVPNPEYVAWDAGYAAYKEEMRLLGQELSKLARELDTELHNVRQIRKELEERSKC
jgi:hypothetical protein